MSSLRSFLGQLRQRMRVASARRQLHAAAAGAPLEIQRSDWSASLTDPTLFYARCDRYFSERLPEDLRVHRAYFSRAGRGFGENAMHVMWYLLWQEFRPSDYLEIGVFRGQTLSLAGLLGARAASPCATFGISPFSSTGDSRSVYAERADYQEDTLKNYARFAQPPPTLLKAFSTDEHARQLIASRFWQVIYIDGNHDYDVARQDWENCAAHVAPGGIIVLDDSGLTTGYRPPASLATGGHPGPSRLAGEVDRAQFQEILQVGHNRVFQRSGSGGTAS